MLGQVGDSLNEISRIRILGFLNFLHTYTDIYRDEPPQLLNSVTPYIDYFLMWTGLHIDEPLYESRTADYSMYHLRTGFQRYFTRF